jgi:tetratricopeptide (TPR) repeat protein
MRSDQRYWAAERSAGEFKRAVVALGIETTAHVSKRRLRKLFDLLSAGRISIDGDSLNRYARILGYSSSSSGYPDLATKFLRLIPERSMQLEDKRIIVCSLLSCRKTGEAANLLETWDWSGSESVYLMLSGKLDEARGKIPEAKRSYREALSLDEHNVEIIDGLLRLPSTQREKSELYRLKADTLVKKGNAKEAVRLYRLLLRKDRNSAGILKSAGIALADAGKYAKAEKYLSSSLGIEYDYDCQVALGVVEAKLGKYSQAYRQFSSANERKRITQGNIIGYFCESCIYTGRREEADRLLNFYCNNLNEQEKKTTGIIFADLAVAGFDRRMYDFSLKASDAAIRAGHEDLSLKKIKLGALVALNRFEEALSFIDGNFSAGDVKEERMATLLGLGRLQEASSIADGVLLRCRDNSQALITKLTAMARAGKEREATEAFAGAVLRAGNADALRVLSEMAKAAGDDITVLKSANAMLSIGERTKTVYNDKATALERLGRIKASEQTFRKLYTSGNAVEAVELLSSFYARHGMAEKEESLLTDAIRANDRLPSGLVYRLAKIKLERGDSEGSLQVLEEHIKRRETPEGLYLQADALNRTGRHEEAIEAARHAMKLGYPAKFSEAMVAEALIALNRNEEALEHYGTAIKCGSNDPLVYVRRARLLNSMGRNEEAISEFAAIERIFATSLSAQEECMTFYYETRQFQKCIETAENIIRSDRKNGTAWKMRGLSMLSLKRYDEAIASLDACETKDHQVLDALKTAYSATNNSISAVKTINSIIETHGSNKELLLEKGGILEKEGKYEDALSIYQSAIREFGPDASVIARKAGILHKQGKFAEEVGLLLELLKTDGNNPLLSCRVADAYLCMRRYSDALEYADRAMQSDPGSPSHMTLRGRILMATQQYAEAERSVDVALTLSPKDATALELKGELLMVEGNFASALDVLNGALAAGICTSNIYRFRGDCLMHIEKFQEALDSYGKAAKMEPGRTDILLGKGICEYSTGKYSSAVMTLNELTRKEHENAKAWCYLGLSLSRQGLTSEARKALEEAVRIEPELPPALLELAKMHLDDCLYVKAKELFAKVLEVEPGNEEAREKLELCISKERRLKSEQNAKSLLKLEYEMNRIPTREEAFSVCKIPIDEIDEAFEAVQEPTALTVPSAGDPGWEAVEDRSAEIMIKCFRNEMTASLGLRLCDIVANFPSYSLDECKQSLDYIRKVQQMNLIEGVEDSRFEKLMKKATKLRPEDRNTIGIVRNLNVGIYTGRLIMGSLAAMGKSGYRSDYVVVSPPVKAPENSTYNSYESRQELMEQYYGSRETAPAEQEEIHQEDEKCLYHGKDAIGECGACQTNICDECLSATGGSCPNCGIILMNEEEGSAGGEL